jgi:hypothetical protein
MAMALENVHPEVLERVRHQLPEGYTVLSAESESESVATFTVEKNGITQKAKMSKGNLLRVMVNRAPEVSAREGDPLGLVVQELSDTYKLHLLDKVDYDVEDTLVTFAGKDQYQVSVPMLDTSISLSGVLIFTVKNKDATVRSQECIAVDLEEQRVRIALAGKVFLVDDPVKDGVSQEYAEMLSDFINSLGFKLVLTVEDFQEAIVVSQLNDGISNLAILQFSSGLVVPVRWN